MNPIREQIRDSRARNKRHNMQWWTANNSLLKINAEIGRIEQQLARLDGLRAEKAALDALQADLKTKMAEEEVWQRNLQAKLSELAASKVIARQINSVPGI